MKKIIKRVLLIILIPIALFFVLAVMLYIPPIQNWAVKKAATYASDATGFNISLEKVRLTFPLSLRMDNLCVTQPSDTLSNRCDTIAQIGIFKVDVSLLPLFRGTVDVNQLSFNDVKINTADIIEATSVKGTFGELKLESHGIDLVGGVVKINDANISDAAVDVALHETEEEDTTTSEPTNWKILLSELLIENTSITLHMPGDTLQIGTYMGKASINDGYFDLFAGLYETGRIEWSEGSIAYDNNYEDAVEGLDFNHLALSQFFVGIDSVSYSTDLMSVGLKECSFIEKSGLDVREISFAATMDSLSLVIPSFRLKTSESLITADVNFGLKSFDDSPSGDTKVSIDGSIGKQDILLFAADMPSGFAQQWPNYPLTMQGVVCGNASQLTIPGVIIDLPTAFNAKAEGSISNIFDDKNMSATIELEANTYDLSFVTAMLEIEGVVIPSGININGEVKANGSTYSADLIAREGDGTIKADAAFNMDAMAYDAELEIDGLQLQHFLLEYDFAPFTGQVVVSGKGVDFTDKSTVLDASAQISSFAFNGYDLSDAGLTAKMRDCDLQAEVTSNNPLIETTISLNALLGGDKLAATMECDIDKVDFQKLQLTNSPFTSSLRVDLQVESDLNNNHKVVGSIKDIALSDSNKTYTPHDIYIDAFAYEDSTHARISSGDMLLCFDAQGSYDNILACLDAITAELQLQLSNKYIDQKRLREHLPVLTLGLDVGSDNAFTRLMNYYGYSFSNVAMNVNTSPNDGINGYLNVDSLFAANMLIDTIRIALTSDTARTDFSGHIRNRKDNPQYCFHALFRGTFYEKGIYFGTRIYDADDVVGVSMGLNAAMEDNGIRLSIGGRDGAIIGYKEFSVNQNNYIMLCDDGRISADLDLVSPDGMAVRLHSNDETEALQDLTLGLSKFELSDVLSVIPYVPSISGVVDGEFHVKKTADDMSLSSSFTIDDLVYEDCAMGDIGCDFTYSPAGEGAHSVDATLSCNGNKVGVMQGTYFSEGDGAVNATLDMAQLPLSMVNGIIPDQIVALKGYGSGALSINGPMSSLQIDGSLRLDSAYIASDPYGVELRFDTESVPIENSRLLLQDFKMYAHNESALSLTGFFDFSNFDYMNLDMMVRATNYLLIDAKENNRSEAYGKAYVNFYAKMSGTLDELQIRGKLDVLGSTDMTYVLRDTPLTTDNQLDDIVKFVNFNDTTTEIITRPPLTGMDMDLTLSVDEAAHILCALNTSKSNYIDIVGGGDLRMQYNASDGLRLIGRYTLNNGEMKYSLPIIPLKTFTIQDGSYIEFTGDPFNARLDITATEQIKASVSSEGENERSVLFNCGVVITKTLQDMGLQFIIEAPEDMTVQNQLQTMTEENRGKIAVTLLTTGMYLDGENTSAFSMNNALSAFLNSQISTISGNALRTLDVSVGVDNTTLESGQTQTDYSFKFAKRFWNNRLNIVVGGKVSTGAEVENQNNSFFNNVTFEYRLKENSNTYLKLFYERDSYDWLEGYISKYGGGFLLRRKLQHFKDIFRFKKSKKETTPTPATPTVEAQPTDSIK